LILSLGERRRLLARVFCLAVFFVSRAGAAESPLPSLRALVRAQGVSGREEEIRKEIQSRLPRGSNPETDNLGNLTVVYGSGRPLRLFVAAMDEAGYVVSRIQEDGYLRLQRLARVPLSPIFDQFIVGQPVLIGAASPGRMVPGVAAVLSTHLQRGRRADPDAARLPVDEDLIIDIGARSAPAAAAAGIRILAPVTLEKDLSVLAGARVAGPALDDRAGCQALLDLAGFAGENHGKGTVVLAWTAQSWVGSRGAERLARRFQPDEVIVLDLYAPDPFDQPARKPEGELGQGPLLGKSSPEAWDARDLQERMRQAARKEGIRIQEVEYGSLHEGKPFRGIPVAVAGVPIRFPGTPIETIDLKDLEALSKWLKHFVSEGE
jgi:putative aminopeptidase FrvX